MADKKKDKRDFTKKALDGDLGSFTTDDVFDAASGASRLLPGKFGDLAAAPIEAVHGSITSERELAELKKELGNSPHVAARNPASRALRRKLDELNNRSGSKLKQYGAIGAGGIAGAAAGSALIPIPMLGTMAGAWLGSEGAEIIYDEAIKTQDQDAVGLVIEMKDMQKRKQPIAAELVFAALASNLPDKEAKTVEDKLFALTGKRKFADAIQDGQNEAVKRLMHEFDMEVRVDTGMPYDPANPTRTASEEYAEYINAGKMDAHALLFREDMPTIMEITKLQEEKQQKLAQDKAMLKSHNIAVDEKGDVVAIPKQTKRLAFTNKDMSAAASMLKQNDVVVDDDGNIASAPKQIPVGSGKGYSKE